MFLAYNIITLFFRTSYCIIICVGCPPCLKSLLQREAVQG